MSLPIWNHLRQQPPTLVATFTEKYAQLVHDSTTQLHQSLNSILSTLNRRAIALTNLANFESALHDAKLMQQLSPSSALGYLCEATIYSEQGKQRQAIHVCDKGLSMVDTKDPDYATLQHAKEVAMQREGNRIDFVSQLPADIVVSRLIPLYMGDHGMRACMPGPYLYVCNNWRDRFLESLGGLRFMICFDIKDECSEVAQFTRYAKELHIVEYSEGSWLSDLLRGHDFCSLRYLHIYRFTNHEDIHFMSTLKSISNTLTRLSITLDTQDDALPIADIMLTCSNLTSLEIIGSRNVDVSSLPMPMEPRSKITALSVTYAKHSIRGDQVIEMLKRFPSLKKLILSPCDDLQSAFVITEYCPLLQHLEIRVGQERLGVQLLYTCFEQSCASQGITYLSLHGHSGPADDDDEFTSLLKEYSHTLERIDWGITLDENDAMRNIQYPRLRKIELHTDGWWIAHNAPTLQEMKITGNAINLNSAVLDPIPSTLTTLAFDLFNDPLLNGDLSCISHYLERLAQHPHFKELDLRLPELGHFANVLDAICRLHQLERLHIKRYSFGTEKMTTFLDQLVHGCPHLKYLHVECNTTLSADSITILKRLPHLQRLQFSLKDITDHASFWDAIQSFTQLTCIQIYPPNCVDKSAIRQLRIQHPDMRIIIGNPPPVL